VRQDPAADSQPAWPKIDTTVSHSARIWNYWLGGKDNYPVDRQVGDQISAMFPDMVGLARADRAFLGRAVRYLTAEAGIRQFLDIGTGLPTVDNTHEVAQQVAPESRIVYVDNDPLVLVHARALLTSMPPGVTDYIHEDLREPGKILTAARRTLDFSKPVAIMILGVLIFILDNAQARAIVNELLDAVPAGSFLAIAHTTNVVRGELTDEAVRHWNQFGEPKMVVRSPQEIARFFGRLELVEPGVVSCSRWRPEPTPFGDPAEVDEFCAVGRKP
jgi:O-methyltransferase involved in polyketide biosynthesis